MNVGAKNKQRVTFMCPAADVYHHTEKSGGHIWHT